ncbi:MAG TPA: SDR family NAD(P)-dependent oxidoreductase [Plantibacter sp.]|uniref:SDR family NAD(P)-dependent oxidoreductase n=1 Tax=Plantibacter sp. TaxID=1871045 RepID=UPI002CEAABB4|nr:SDR family NAD(P)-dependent oxidoreductase [Plantibacter sp.]
MTWDPAHLPTHEGRTFVVTGATAGIGYFAAEQLAATGAHVVLASRSADKLAVALRAIREHVPKASLSTALLDLASLSSVRAASEQLVSLPRLDSVLLNGGSMTMRRTDRTRDGLPMIVGTHVIANTALVAGILPALRRSGSASDGRPARIVHTSTGFVAQFAMRPGGGALLTPRVSIAAYTKAKTITEVFAFELDRRLRAAGLPVHSIVTRPGVGVDAKTPTRAGIRDATTPYQRNPYTPWAQGKDTAAWSAVRAMTDPAATGGEYYAPSGRLRGLPERVDPTARTAAPAPEVANRIWDELEELTGAPILPGA